MAEPPSRLNMLPLDRPVKPHLLDHALRGALASRRRQYRIRDQIEALEAAKLRNELLLYEVQHRSKNNLARISSILRQTWRTASDGEQLLNKFEQRVAAMARAQGLLTESEWQGADLKALVLREVAAQDETLTGRVTVEGPPVQLSSRAALSLHLALHELTVNACKYGAFTHGDGRVAVCWDVAPDAAGQPRLRFDWRESGGPPVETPRRTGFGTTLIERAIALEFDGTAQIDFDRTGVHARMDLDVEGLQRNDDTP
jgi:two-component sensor histidine kinase